MPVLEPNLNVENSNLAFSQQSVCMIMVSPYGPCANRYLPFSEQYLENCTKKKDDMQIESKPISPVTPGLNIQPFSIYFCKKASQEKIISQALSCIYWLPYNDSQFRGKHNTLHAIAVSFLRYLIPACRRGNLVRPTK